MRDSRGKRRRWPRRKSREKMGEKQKEKRGLKEIEHGCIFTGVNSSPLALSRRLLLRAVFEVTRLYALIKSAIRFPLASSRPEQTSHDNCGIFICRRDNVTQSSNPPELFVMIITVVIFVARSTDGRIDYNKIIIDWTLDCNENKTQYKRRFSGITGRLS